MMSAMEKKWKFLVIADDTPEFKKVLRLASLRAAKVNGSMVMLRIIQPSEFQHWMSVREIMEEEAMQEAEEMMNEFAREVKEISGLDCEKVIRKGEPGDVITQYIEEDQEIHMLVLGANVDGDPGPLVKAFREELLNVLHMPVLVVPGNMTDEDIDHFV
ncbi:universal stress protein UspA [Paremcibacter congregatus]|uniref:Universal stress protein UspA n=2 Tax=Paremcibacter congregatus TaxID=2043170 RepID=A0A2G4YUJ1_9PROT|nr:universal stress protein [Paremcibacter congregatus]PHZ86004.1 universal stress protein UspA [Paremcibacter congregatus]QDE26969.1 universal stress protein [Paremcibacter congregatus]